MMGHYFYKNNSKYDFGNVSHGKILHNKLYVEIEGKRIYKWSVIKIGNEKNSYEELKNKYLFYNSQFLLNKNKNKINTIYTNTKDISTKKEKLNGNIFKENSYLIIDPNSNLIIHYNANSDLKNIISDIKRLLKYARF
jgi:cytochrome oxidase Cu insertion factor (SCO1/SenC/PrrC family)